VVTFDAAFCSQTSYRDDMNSGLLRLLRPRRHVSLGRVVGVGAWLSVALWSVVVLGAIGAYRDPTFLTSLGSAGGVSEVASLLFGVVPATVLPLVVAGVALVVIPLRLIREVRREFGRGRRGYTNHGGYGPDDTGAVGGSLLGGGLLGGVFDVGDAFDGDGGGDDGGDE
jgi:hypothetical protein